MLSTQEQHRGNLEHVAAAQTDILPSPPAPQYYMGQKVQMWPKSSPELNDALSLIWSALSDKAIDNAVKGYSGKVYFRLFAKVCQFVASLYPHQLWSIYINA